MGLVAVPVLDNHGGLSLRWGWSPCLYWTTTGGCPYDGAGRRACTGQPRGVVPTMGLVAVPVLDNHGGLSLRWGWSPCLYWTTTGGCPYDGAGCRACTGQPRGVVPTMGPVAVPVLDNHGGLSLRWERLPCLYWTTTGGCPYDGSGCRACTGQPRGVVPTMGPVAVPVLDNHGGLSLRWGRLPCLYWTTMGGCPYDGSGCRACLGYFWSRGQRQ